MTADFRRVTLFAHKKGTSGTKHKTFERFLVCLASLKEPPDLYHAVMRYQQTSILRLDCMCMNEEHAYKTVPILLVIISKLLGYLEQRFAGVSKAKVPAAVLKSSLV